MNRRDIISLGAGVCVSAIAGCLGRTADSADGGSDNESLWADEGENTSNGESSADEPLERIVIGDESETDAAYSLYVRNASDDERSVEIQIEHDEETVLDRTEDVPAEAYLEVALVDSGTYETTVESESSQSSVSMTPPSGDCEESRTVMTLGDGGIGVDTSIVC
ncbi:hypothetical protein [Natronorubrum texcoconense]|uniref:Ig-like domain-containing protein n=1 Tax=Natronorubrum texcoconense TaxID=1095776 RepID=A0A1G8VP87_9EURY|nr:hypothetical protein [Natronorubrum texcoconense]SDJ67812.1 hypothetical protein SAMN04515672_1436 [Natronorubrum texcoconense]